MDSFKVYINIEIEAITELTRHIEGAVPLIRKNLTRYEEAKPRVKEILLDIAGS